MLFVLVASHGCSFLVASYNLSEYHSPAQIAYANEVQQRRGPDATKILFEGGWTFLHNLLSMTGVFTLQPFISYKSTGAMVALFNGEIYNYRELALELTGHPDSFLSDGHVLLPAYKRWGANFVRRLHGEFSLVLVDFTQRHLLLSADVFGTKPLWWAAWRERAETEWRFLIASYESVLTRLGAPAEVHQMAAPNEALLFGFGGRGRFPLRKVVQLKTWDLRQHKNSSSDWAAAFQRAVAVRTRGIKHRVFIGLSSGYDSGAIMLALKLQVIPAQQLAEAFSP